MNTKLTLNIDKKVISEAKDYARDKQTSVSRLVEQYLRFIALKKVSGTSSGIEKSVVDELTGIISLPANFNEREIITSHLIEKYEAKK